MVREKRLQMISQQFPAAGCQPRDMKWIGTRLQGWCDDDGGVGWVAKKGRGGVLSYATPSVTWSISRLELDIQQLFRHQSLHTFVPVAVQLRGDGT